VSKNSLCATCIIGLALSGMALILLIPSLFNTDQQSNIWIMVVLGCLASVFAAGAVYWKPTSSTTDDDR